MADLDWFFGAPNIVQPAHVKVHRLKLGNPAYEKYAYPAVSTGFFALWIPPLGGDLHIEVEGGQSANIQLWDGMKPLKKVLGPSLVHRFDQKTFGRFDVHVSDVRHAVRAVLTLEGWPTDADGGPLIPWNFWFFPYHRQPVSPQDPPSRFRSHETQISAMRNYDALVPPTPGAHSAESWERAHHCRGADHWEGHCDPSAYASVYFEQPKPSVTLRGVTFSRHELELLAAEWSGARYGTIRGWRHDETARAPVLGRGDHKAFATHLLKPGEKPTEDLLAARYANALGKPSAKDDDSIRAEAKRVASNPEAIRAAFGRAALSFWDFLVAEALHGHEPIVGDVGPSGENPQAVWNHAITLYRLSVVEDAAIGDPRCVRAQVDVYVNLDREPKPTTPNDPADGSPAEARNSRPVLVPGMFQHQQYVLTFRFAAGGALERADWKVAKLHGAEGGNVYAPRRFGIPAKPRSTAAMPDVGRVPPANTIIGDAILQLVRLRARYR